MENSQIGFNPFKRDFSKAEVDRIFGPNADGALAQKLFKENPSLYRALRAQAEKDGRVGNVPKPYSAWRLQTDRQFTDREIELRAKYSEAECRALFCKSGDTGGSNNAGNLFKNDPQKYNEMREASVSFGIIPASQPAPIVHTDKPVKQDDGGVTLSDENADRLNLPRGTRVSAAQYEKIITILNPVPVTDGTKE